MESGVLLSQGPLQLRVTWSRSWLCFHPTWIESGEVKYTEMPFPAITQQGLHIQLNRMYNKRALMSEAGEVNPLELCGIHLYIPMCQPQHLLHEIHFSPF